MADESPLTRHHPQCTDDVSGNVETRAHPPRRRRRLRQERLLQRESVGDREGGGRRRRHDLPLLRRERGSARHDLPRAHAQLSRLARTRPGQRPPPGGPHPRRHPPPSRGTRPRPQSGSGLAGRAAAQPQVHEPSLAAGGEGLPEHDQKDRRAWTGRRSLSPQSPPADGREVGLRDTRRDGDVVDVVREGIRPRRYGRSDRRFHPHRIAVAVLSLLICGAAAAAEPPAGVCAAEVGGAPETSLRARAKEVWCDAKDIFPAPVPRWPGTQWKRLGEGLALVAAYPLDRSISNLLARNHSTIGNFYLHNVTHLGGGYGQDLTLVLIAGGYFGHNQKLLDTGFDSLEASVFASGIVTPAIKDVVGRARPIADLTQHTFHPFNNGVYQSFPSGHTTKAFAIATTFADHYQDKPVVEI